MRIERKKLILMIGAILIPIILIIIITLILTHINRHPHIEITNLDEYVGNNIRNREKERQAEEMLYNTSKLNKEQTGTNEKAKIREGSFSQKEEKQIIYVSFLVDIENLRETFSVKYAWSENKEIKVDQWETNVLCPKASDNIYSDFKCKDSWTEAYGTNDPIVVKLPYHKVEQYYISYKDGVITVAITGCRTDVIEPNKQAADTWLKENIKNLNEYKVEYTYCN